MEEEHGSEKDRTVYCGVEKRERTDAEKLFMTDKAVSKWECGFSNPSGAAGENKKVG